MQEQCGTKAITLGNISDEEMLYRNLEENSIPQNIVSMDISDYESFLQERRKLMAKLMQRYYQEL